MKVRWKIRLTYYRDLSLFDANAMLHNCIALWLYCNWFSLFTNFRFYSRVLGKSSLRGRYQFSYTWLRFAQGSFYWNYGQFRPWRPSDRFSKPTYSAYQYSSWFCSQSEQAHSWADSASTNKVQGHDRAMQWVTGWHAYPALRKMCDWQEPSCQALLVWVLRLHFDR